MGLGRLGGGCGHARDAPESGTLMLMLVSSCRGSVDRGRFRGKQGAASTKRQREYSG